MKGAFRIGIVGLGLLFLFPLASCGSGGTPQADTPTPTLWQLPPEFTKTVSPTMTFTPSPRVSATPTVPEFRQASAVPLAAGWNHTCAVADGGVVMCWGDNEHGQLGDGSRTDRNRPVEVKNLDVPAAAVAAGMWHTCILTDEGGVKCWGRNSDGQLGNGTIDRSSEPVDVIGLESGVAAIAAGDDHACALTAAGAVQCWGNNDYGQLGDGTTDSRNTPVGVQGLEGGATGIAAGAAHTCASTASGEVLCWGNNGQGQLGNGSDTPSSAAPTEVAGLTEGFTGLAGKGDHTCVLTVSGGIQCWGQNKFGQLGDGTLEAQFSPVAAGLDGPVKILAVGWNHTCGVLTDGILKCWGWNFYGQLGEGSTANRRQPIDVVGLNGGTLALAGGGGHTCAVLEDADVYCWGWNENGQLGNHTNQDSLLPVKVIGITVPITAG
jgi:alpha-tubulin suppressor-like RCC1 family protein